MNQLFVLQHLGRWEAVMAPVLSVELLVVEVLTTSAVVDLNFQGWMKRILVRALVFAG